MRKNLPININIMAEVIGLVGLVALAFPWVTITLGSFKINGYLFGIRSNIPGLGDVNFANINVGPNVPTFLFMLPLMLYLLGNILTMIGGIITSKRKLSKGLLISSGTLKILIVIGAYLLFNYLPQLLASAAPQGTTGGYGPSPGGGEKFQPGMNIAQMPSNGGFPDISNVSIEPGIGFYLALFSAVFTFVSILFQPEAAPKPVQRPAAPTKPPKPAPAAAPPTPTVSVPPGAPTALTKTCPYCGASIPQVAEYCPNCKLKQKK